MTEVVTELQAAGDDDEFDPVGKSVEKHVDLEDGGEDGTTVAVQGRIVEVLEEEGDVLCSVQYEDGSTELFPFAEARDRIIADPDADESDEEDEEKKDGGVERSAQRAASSSSSEQQGGPSGEGVAALTAVAHFALAWVTHRGKSGLVRVECPASMLESMAMLHDCIFYFSGLEGVACREVRCS